MKTLQNPAPAVQFGQTYRIKLDIDTQYLNDWVSPATDEKLGAVAWIENDTLVLTTNTTTNNPKPASDMVAALQVGAKAIANAWNRHKSSQPRTEFLQKKFPQTVIDFFDALKEKKTLL